jgi:hypothetical protein
VPHRRLIYPSALALLLIVSLSAGAQESALPDAPSALLRPVATTAAEPVPSSSATEAFSVEVGAPPADASVVASDSISGWTPQKTTDVPPKEPCPIDPRIEVDKNCNLIPLERQQPHRILGFMPNFRSVSAGAVAHPPGWKYNFKITTQQAFDYSAFIFLGLTTISAEGIDEHPVLGKGVGGFYAYVWRGFLDKTDGSYLQAWFLPSLLHEDTRYFPLGKGHPIVVRALYVISRQGVTHTYGEHQTPNISGLGGKVLTQLVSRTYYPPGATSFSELATKFGYSAMRDVGFTSIREFYPDVAAYYVKRHRRKIAEAAAKAAADTGAPPSAAKP